MCATGQAVAQASGDEVSVQGDVGMRSGVYMRFLNLARDLSKSVQVGENADAGCAFLSSLADLGVKVGLDA